MGGQTGGQEGQRHSYGSAACGVRESCTLDAVAGRHGATAQTVWRHVSCAVAGRPLLLGSDVHIGWLRVRREFRGEIGHTRAGEQTVKVINDRNRRSRNLHTRLVT